MMDYVAIRMIHETAVALSVTGFFIRGLGRLAGAEPLGGRLARSLPHVIDTVLLSSALVLAWMLGITPLSAPWLMAKVFGLLAYVGLGVVAMHARVSTGVRLAAWIGALVTAGWIVSVAVTKNPLGVLSLV
jgi:uncharacterized membrane protein SirB2